ncbi:S-layer homology domain-containing protein [uncultured Flavonifractor sp.]|uniref:S-layer homology domain-containing protein n=1 Tax=uncultured Flavonifractor sp. TaxID=1193534 RepID=UPI00266FC7AD|nr:S-layer homology domain-containing protein [uncultured Flavonifractor sp.]
MRHKLKPLLSALLTIAMLLSLLPTAVFAASGTGTFTKITTQEELTDGKYVIVVDSGYAMGALDGTWLTATQVTEEGGSLTDPDASLVWEIAVTDSGVTLTDANGTQVAPKGGNNNGIQAGDYTWATSFENGAFRFLGTGEDTVTLASNKNSENKFRAYKNATINAGYPCDFTLYQYVEGTGTPDPGPGPDEPTVISISDALAAADGTEKLTVKGVVTLLDGQNVYLQDSTGGICARMSGQFDDIALGDTVIATGERAEYNGLPQLGNATYEKSSGLTLTPTVKTIGELTTADICTYVTIQNVEVTEVYDKDGTYSNPNITVKDADGKTIQLYKAVVEKNEDGTWPVKVGGVITITAAVGVFNDTLQLRNTTAAEIDLDGTPAGPIAHGEQVVIYNPQYDKALSSTYKGYYNNGTDVTMKNGTLSGFTSSDVWTVIDNGDGTWSFSYAGQNIGMNADKTSMPLGGPNDKWELSEADNGLFYVRNTVRNAYMEYQDNYGTWSAYYNINAGSEGMFALSFYKVTEIPEEPSGDLPKNGDTVVIYNLSAQGVLAGEGDNQVVNNAAATVTDGVATPTNGARVFTVEQNGEWFRFKTDYDGYLCSNGTGNNAFYSKDSTDDADWKLEAYNGGFTLESRTAKFNGKYSQFLEYYGGTYKSYSMNKVTDKDIFTFQFYPVSSDVKVTEGVVNAPVVNFGTLPEAYVGQDYTVTFTVDAVFGVAEGLTAKYGTTDAVLTNDNGTYTFTIPGSAMVAGDLVITIEGMDNKDVAFTGTTTLDVKDEPYILEVFPAANAQTGDNKTPEIGFTFGNAGKNPTIVLKVGDQVVTHTVEGNKVSYKPDTDLPDGKVTVTATVTRTDNKKAEYTWSFTIGTAQYQLYFGQLHSHTAEYSDGAGTLQEGLNYVANLSESANVDFVAFTDHSNYFDASGAANPEAALYDPEQMSEESAAKWNAYTGAINAFNQEHAGEVVALAGFEMTWSGGPGHINTFNTPGIVSRNNTTLNNKTADAGMKAYYALLSNPALKDSISQFNHPGTTFGNFSDFGYYDPIIDTRMHLVEVGNGEGAIGAGGYYPSYEQYIMALDKGWHVAPTNNQDNHKGKWGNANDARDVVLTDNFSEEGIYEAIRNYRVYATEDKNLEINYTLNGQMLGSIISDVPENVTINVSVYDPDASDSISKVEVVVNSGAVAYTWDDPTKLVSGELECTIPASYSYYFIRVTQGDGDLAVTAPVWVGDVVKLGISAVECGTSSPVTGEELTLTTTLFNSETSDATVKSITYTSGEETLGMDTKGYEIPASGTLNVDWKYTPKTAKVMTITATVVMEQGGIEYTYSKDISLDILDASKLVYIGIDASHYNEYVNGNYKDSMGNFGDLAAGYSVRTVQLNTSEDLIAACENQSGKYKAIILTAPSRRNGDALRDPYVCYSDAEIQALKAFNAAGGTLVLAGWSDYYEHYESFPAADHMAAQQNKVLEALGSSLRIGDDATNDDTLNGGQTQRLYLSTYNWDHFLMNGVEFDSENPNNNLYSQLFSQYGGASIYVVDAEGNPTSTLPDTVSPVVYGHATTYSKDSDNDGLGGDSMPKYAVAEGDNRLMVLATEDLGDDKGLIIVSGAAFMSNFEVQAQIGDSGAEKNYSNYNICENLVNYINPVTITNIADVQAQKQEGIKYVIEGVVTSNASGYDKDTAFFDCIYVQDGTAGINAFPVAGNYKIGDKVRITGTTSSYQGERQIAVTSIEKIGEGTVEPKLITTKEAAESTYLGSLVQIKGVVVSFAEAEGLVQTIMVRDESGYDARVFIDGYITKDKAIENLAVGHEITVTGLASYDNTFNAPEGPFPRIRIRDRADIICGTEVVDIPPAYVPPTSTTYAITVEGSDNGTVTASRTRASKGLTITLTVKADEGYELNVLTVTDKNGNEIKLTDKGDGKYTFAMPASAVTVEASFAAKSVENELPFTDVDVDDWFYSAVKYVYDNDLMNGTSATQFSPFMTTSRAMILTILARYNGVDTSTGATWYEAGVAWAVENGVSDGTNLEAAVSREQLVTMLWRLVGSPVIECDLTAYPDSGSVSDWAAQAMAWAVDTGIIIGTGAGTLNPQGNATRAEVAAVLARFAEND